MGDDQSRLHFGDLHRNPQDPQALRNAEPILFPARLRPDGFSAVSNNSELPVYLVNAQDEGHAYVLSEPDEQLQRVAPHDQIEVWCGEECRQSRQAHPQYYEVPPRRRVRHVLIYTFPKRTFDPQEVRRYIALLQLLGDDLHVVRPLEALEDEDFYYLILPRPRQTLAAEIPFHEANPLPLERTRTLVRQMVRTVIYLSERGIAHLRLRPESFGVWGPNRLILMDLGRARQVHVGPETGRRLHSAPLPAEIGPLPSYACPELVEGREFDAGSADLWSVAVMAYNLLTNRIPFDLPLSLNKDFRYLVLDRGLAGAQATRGVDRPALEWLSHLLRADPNDRWTPREAIDSEFLGGDGTP